MIPSPLSLFSQTNPPPTAVVSTNKPPAAVTDKLEGNQMDVANGFFNREFYDLAMAEYQKYLDWFPKGIYVEEAGYRIAECLRGLNKSDAARDRFQAVQKAFPKGSFFARTSFRLGEMEWNAGHDAEASKKFGEAAERSDQPEIRLSARFYQARAFIRLGKTEEAAPMLRELAQVDKQNPYRGFALLELAKLAENKGEDDEARLLYSKLMEIDSILLLRAEAAIKAGTLEMKSKHWEAAAICFEKIRQWSSSEKSDDDTQKIPEDWIVYANDNLARVYYQNDQYAAVLQVLMDKKSRFSTEAQPGLNLIHAHTLRILKKYKEAVSLYDFFLKNNPGHPSMESAAYERLICLYALEDPRYDEGAAAFLKTYPKATGLPQILYLQASRAFQKKDYIAAAASYSKISLQGTPSIKADLVPEIMLRLAFSLVQAGRHPEAIQAYTNFIQRFPKHTSVPNALFQRGLSEQAINKPDKALVSFQEVVSKFPKAPERESALYRSALISGDLKSYDAMRSAFQQLTKDYPKNPFNDDAAYWMGWSFYEEKKYAEAVPYLDKARKADAKKYGPQCTSRIILAYYHLKQAQGLLKETDPLPANSPDLAPEILDWLARQCVKEGNHAAAEKQFRKLLSRPDASAWSKATRWDLATTLVAQSKWKEAVEIWEQWQKDYPTPEEIISAKLKLIRGYTALKEFTKAEQIGENVLQLQPEGRNNADARFLLGEAMAAQQKYNDAGKYFLSVAVLYDDKDLTPKSLSRAIQSFDSAGETNQVIKLQKELKEKYPDYKGNP